eukprot:m.341467 g.341467  ORF g.341467 m.341467 type:complete len:222 (-) comp20610_c0_seq1:958-1623(-)
MRQDTDGGAQVLVVVMAAAAAAAGHASSAVAGDGTYGGTHLRMPEVEFLAEEQQVEIVPNFEAEHFRFIGGDIGPFRPQRPISVPLWLAVTLRKRQKCTVNPPIWLTKEFLTQRLEEEQALRQAFTKMPDHFQEVAAILFECAAADIQEAEAVRSLLASIYDLRYSKMRSGLANAKDSEAIKMNNLSIMEISAIRPFFVDSMDSFFVLHEAVDEAFQGAPG